MENVNEENGPKKFLGVMFDCCSVYGRLYKNAQGTHYVGRCPKCMRNIRVKVGEGGTSQRFFRAQ